MADNKKPSSDKRVSLSSRVSKTPAKRPAAKTAPAKRGSNGGSVNLTQHTAKKAAAHQAKSKKPVGKIIMWSLMTVFLVLCVVLFIVVYPLLKDMFGSGDPNAVHVPDEDVIGFTQTPSDISDKVSYYLVGLFGEDLTTQMESLALVCYDKDAGKVNIMEVPTDTILSNNDGHWAVRKIGNVWSNPKSITWCDNCKKQVFAPEIGDNTHSVCGSVLTAKEGSAPTNLIEAFNYEYSMPIDNYYLFQRGSLKETVEFLGGLDVKLEKSITLGTGDDKKHFEAGVQTLSGAQVVEYMTCDKTGVNDRVNHQIARRQVWVALFQRLAALDADTMYKEVLYPVMNWDNPIKMHRLSDYMETDTKELCQLIAELGKLPKENFTFYMMPGEAAKSGGVSYYTGHKSEVAALLQQAFNPYGDPLTEANLTMEEITKTKNGDSKQQTFAQLTVEQTGIIAND